MDLSTNYLRIPKDFFEIFYDCGLSEREKTVLAYICRFSLDFVNDHAKYVDVSAMDVEKATGIRIDKVYITIKTLVRKGYIRSEATEKWKKNRYIVSMYRPKKGLYSHTASTDYRHKSGLYYRPKKGLVYRPKLGLPYRPKLCLYFPPDELLASEFEGPKNYLNLFNNFLRSEIPLPVKIYLDMNFGRLGEEVGVKLSLAREFEILGATYGLSELLYSCLVHSDDNFLDRIGRPMASKKTIEGDLSKNVEVYRSEMEALNDEVESKFISIYEKFKIQFDSGEDFPPSLEHDEVVTLEMCDTMRVDTEEGEGECSAEFSLYEQFMFQKGHKENFVNYLRSGFVANYFDFLGVQSKQGGLF